MSSAARGRILPSRKSWFKLNIKEWRTNLQLRSCSLSARGLWIEMLCLMHEATPRGSLVIAGRAVTEEQLAVLTDLDIEDIACCLDELHEAGVYSIDEDGTIFCRRMRRDFSGTDA